MMPHDFTPVAGGNITREWTLRFGDMPWKNVLATRRRMRDVGRSLAENCMEEGCTRCAVRCYAGWRSVTLRLILTGPPHIVEVCVEKLRDVAEPTMVRFNGRIIEGPNGSYRGYGTRKGSEAAVNETVDELQAAAEKERAGVNDGHAES